MIYVYIPLISELSLLVLSIILMKMLKCTKISNQSENLMNLNDLILNKQYHFQLFDLNEIKTLKYQMLIVILINSLCKIINIFFDNILAFLVSKVWNCFYFDGPISECLLVVAFVSHILLQTLFLSYL